MLIRTTQTLLLALTLLAGTSRAEPLITEEAILSDRTAWMEQLLQGDPRVVSPANPGQSELFLGRLHNEKTGHQIEIYCTDGTRVACNQLSFYRVAGIRQPQPIAKATVANIEQIVRKKEFRLLNASHFMFEDTDPVDSALYFVFGVGEVMMVADLVSAPVRVALRGNGKYNKARIAVYRALTTGQTVTIKDSQFNALLGRLEEFEAAAEEFKKVQHQ